MMLAPRLRDYIAACFTGLWVRSHEHEDAIREIAELCRQNGWRPAMWDIDRGLSVAGQSDPSQDGADPLAAIHALGSMGAPDTTTLLVLPNFHRLLNSAEIVQALVHQLTTGKQNRTFVVVLSPVVEIPTELEKLFVVVEHDLPDRQQLNEIARSIATEPGELPDGQHLDAVLDAAAGLTRYEAEGAYALSLVRHGRIEPEALWEIKAQMLKKSGLLQLHRGDESFSALGGLDALKGFCTRALAPGRTVKPRGLLLLGVPGTGKSAFAKALGNETERPCLTLDLGALYGSLVGQTEQNVRQALRIADAMAPCICFVDEIEKALAGLGAQGDSGVSTRLFGTLLTWLSDHESDVFFIGTCNDIAKLPPEFSRAERFDGVFFLDLPDRSEKDAIWQIYRTQLGTPADQPQPDDTDWTGAEIRACCRLAALLDVSLTEAARNVVPVAVTAGDRVEKLRGWASGRCLSASRPGLYHRDGSTGSKARRRIHRDPSNN